MLTIDSLLENNAKYPMVLVKDASENTVNNTA